MGEQRPDQGPERGRTSPGAAKHPTSGRIGHPGNTGQVRNDSNYRDRPTDDGKHGDADKEPNEGFPHEE